MSFLAPALLGGIALVALPVILHLVMRREPQRVEFPALRFVRIRQSTNQHRLRLRHWLLLLLRCAFVLLLALALARPVLEGSGLRGNQEAGYAAAVVVDNSARMEYLVRDETRLDEARDSAAWLLEQFPAEAEVALVVPGSSRRAKLGSRDAALLRTERLGPSAASAPLVDAVVEAIDLVSQRPDHRREVYVFTDLSVAAWNNAAMGQVVAALDNAEATRLHLVDVGVERPVNAGLGQLELSAEHLSTGETLTLQTTVQATEQAAGAERSVEVWIAEADGQAKKRGDTSVELTVAPTSVELPMAGLASGVHQGYVRLEGNDPLAVDNLRYFTVHVTSPPRILLVAREVEATRLLREALAPSTLAQTAAPRFRCESVTYENLQRGQLNTYDAVMVLDPPPLADEQWRMLTDFVQSGGGVAIFLGRNAVGHLDRFNAPAPRLLLPAELKWVSNTPRYLQPLNYQHPVLKELADIAEATPWPAFPVFRAWAVANLDPAASVVASFADGSPAIVEGLFGSGRVLLMTTPVSDRASDEPWNLLPTNPDPWPFLALAEGLADYVVGAERRQLNYEAGRVVSLPLPPRSDLATFVLQPPSGEPLAQSLAPGQEDIVITSTLEVGNYRLRSGGERARLDLGFSVNAPADVGRVDRVSRTDLRQALGPERVQITRGRSDLSTNINLGTTGRELYPWLIAIVALVLGCEQWLADRFYRQ